MNFRSAMAAVLSTILLLTLAGCRNPPPSRAMNSNAPALRGIKSWVAAGAGPYDGKLIGTLEYDNQSIPVVGRLDLINAYRFTLALQTVDGKCAFVLHRNWAGTHFLRSPSDSYRALARTIGEEISLAFRRPEGPWRAVVTASTDVVRYKNANDSKFDWRLTSGPNHLLLTQLLVKRPAGSRFIFTFIDDAAGVPAGMTMSDSSPQCTLQLQLTDRNQVTAMAHLP